MLVRLLFLETDKFAMDVQFLFLAYLFHNFFFFLFSFSYKEIILSIQRVWETMSLN